MTKSKSKSKTRTAARRAAGKTERKPKACGRIRRRTRNQGSNLHPRKVTVRVTERLSNELASIQGLIYAFGRRETVSRLFEQVMMPALREYVKPYARKAQLHRKAVADVKCKEAGKCS